MSNLQQKTPYTVRVALGEIPGASVAQTSGHNEAISNTWETIWAYSTGVYTFPAVAERINITGGVNDTAAGGTGARIVLVTGLNAAYVAQQETVAMNGAAGVLTVNSYLRIRPFLCVVLIAGSNGTNVGTITFTTTPTGTILGTIGAGEGRLSAAVFTVPSTHNFMMTGFTGVTAGSQISHIRFSHNFGMGTAFTDAFQYDGYDLGIQKIFDPPQALPATCDIRIDARSEVAASIKAASYIHGWLEPV